MAQKCAEPGTQRRNRCGGCGRSCRCGRCDRRKSPREGKLGGSAGKSAGGSASDSKDKENCGVAQKCAEPGTQRRDRCGGCGRCGPCGRYSRGGGKSRCNSRCSSNSPRTRTTGEQPKDKENCGVAQKCAEREDQRKTTRWAGCVAGGTHRPRTWSSVDLIAQLCDEVTNLAWRPEATKSENRLNFDARSEKPSRGRGSHTGGSVHVAAAVRCAREQNGKRAHQGDTSRELSLASCQQRIHYVDLSAA